MTIAKIKVKGQWVNLYADEINSRLKISRNLADLSDVATARENLGLVGDVSTHNHDSQYMSLIEKITASGTESSGAIETERQRRIEADEKLESELKSKLLEINVNKEVKAAN